MSNIMSLECLQECLQDSSICYLSLVVKLERFIYGFSD